MMQPATEVSDSIPFRRRRQAWRATGKLRGGWDEVGDDAPVVRRLARRSKLHRSVNVATEFRRLRDQWQNDTMWSSSSTDMILHPAYQMIVGLGMDVVPHILADLKAGPHHWGWALRHITREDPVPDGCDGDITAIANAWLAWGSERGLV